MEQSRKAEFSAPYLAALRMRAAYLLYAALGYLVHLSSESEDYSRNGKAESR